MSDLTLFDGRRCIACAGPLPDGSRSDRETCSAACRQRVSRHARSVTSEGAPAPTVHSDPEPAPAPAPLAAPARLPRPVEVRHVPGRRMANGDPAGVGGRTTYVVGGREFATPRGAIDFASR